MRDHIVQACNELLRKQAAEEAEAAVELAKDDAEAQPEVSVSSSQSPPNAKRGNALIGAYNLLRKRVRHLSMQAALKLYFQRISA